MKVKLNPSFHRIVAGLGIMAVFLMAILPVLGGVGHAKKLLYSSTPLAQTQYVATGAAPITVWLPGSGVNNVSVPSNANYSVTVCQDPFCVSQLGVVAAGSNQTFNTRDYLILVSPSGPSGATVTPTPSALGMSSITVTTANVTLTTTQNANNFLNISGTLTGNRQLILPLVQGREYTIYNGCSGAYTLTAIGASGTGYILPQGRYSIVLSDGTNYYNGFSQLTGTVVGAGTAYSLTTSLAAVTFGTTSPTLTLQPGTYLLTGNLSFTGGTTADNYSFELYNTTASAAIGPAHSTNDPASADTIDQPMSYIATFTVPTTVTMYAANLTSARGTIVSTTSYLLATQVG